jgi:RES domain-containing protein
LKGRRFNWQGLETLYLALSIETAIREVTAGFAHRLSPYLICSYDLDCDDLADLRNDAARAKHGVALSDLACAWGDALLAGKKPASWTVVRRLLDAGHAGALVPSFANGAGESDHNLVLWTWSRDLPHKVTVYDPEGKLPKNMRSWE